MVGEHFETEKFTTMVQVRGHEWHCTRPRREGEHMGLPGFGPLAGMGSGIPAIL